MRALTETLAECYPDHRRLLIFGTTTDKDAAAMLRVAVDGFDEIILTKYSTNPRAVSVESLCQTMRSVADVSFDSTPNLQEARELAYAMTGNEGLICVAGSFFLAAEMAELLNADAERGLVD